MKSNNRYLLNVVAYTLSVTSYIIIRYIIVCDHILLYSNLTSPNFLDTLYNLLYNKIVL